MSEMQGIEPEFYSEIREIDSETDDDPGHPVPLTDILREYENTLDSMQFADTDAKIDALLIVNREILSVLRAFSEAAVPTFEKLSKSPIIKMLGGK